MDIVSEPMPPDVDQAEDDDGDPVFSISLSLSELDRTWHSASHMIPADSLSPDTIAQQLIQCCIGVAAARGSATLIALQQRLMEWGTDDRA